MEKKETLLDEAVRTAILITERIAEGDIQEASDLRLLLNHQIDQLLKLRRLYDEIYDENKKIN